MAYWIRAANGDFINLDNMFTLEVNESEGERNTLFTVVCTNCHHKHIVCTFETHDDAMKHIESVMDKWDEFIKSFRAKGF